MPHFFLLQVYEVLFRKFTTRMNFKVRMRKHDIRSIRAPSDVRVKLIDLTALPPHCPVCGLIRVPEMETLAKSYGLTPPNVFYDVFKAGEPVSPVASTSSSSSKKTGRPKKGEKSRSKGSSSGNKTTVQGVVHRQQFVAPGGSQSSHAAAMYGHQGDGTMMMNAAYGAGMGVVSGQPSSNYGIVPYLTSGKDKHGSSAMTSPGVTMTSSAPVSTDQITLGIGSDSDSLIVSIPRNLTPYKVATPTKISGFNPLLTADGSMPPHAQSNQQRPVVLYGGSRSKVLQNLAKKITQKSRKFTTSLNSGGLLRNSLNDPSSSSKDYGGSLRVCPSCNQMSPSIKKSCQFCGEFLVGKTCQNCGALNHNRIKECTKCLAPMKSLGECIKLDAHITCHSPFMYHVYVSKKGKA